MQPIHFLTAGCSELPHRDGSSKGVHSRQNRDGTKQLYGLRPTRVPTSRRRCLLFPSRGRASRVLLFSFRKYFMSRDMTTVAILGTYFPHICLAISAHFGLSDTVTWRLAGGGAGRRVAPVNVH